MSHPTKKGTASEKRKKARPAEPVRHAATVLPEQKPSNIIQKIVYAFARKDWSVASQDPAFMDRQQELIWNFLLDRYFRVEMDGWEGLPEPPCLLAGVHSGTWLTMDAWTLCASWYRHFGQDRILHGTAHDALMAMPLLGGYFRKAGVIPACREGVTAALSAGHDVVVFPGGEVDSMRSFSKRDQVVLAGRKGFIRQAIRSGVPIVPVASIGGPDTVFVLSEGRFLAKLLHTKQLLRSEIVPIVLGFPFGVMLEFAPLHIPMPAKIRTRLMGPIFVDKDPERASDDEYVEKIYGEVESSMARGIAELAKKRKFPVFF